jgi:hypothetical protein
VVTKAKLVGLGLQTLYSLLMVVFSGYFAIDAFLNRKIPLLGIGLGVCALFGLVAFVLRLRLLIQLRSDNRMNNDR